MIKGGYKVINLGDVNITLGEGKTLSGLHESIEASYRKPIIISGITVSGVEYRDVFANFISVTDGFAAFICNPDPAATAEVKYIIHVSSADELKISVIA